MVNHGQHVIHFMPSCSAASQLVSNAAQSLALQLFTRQNDATALAGPQAAQQSRAQDPSHPCSTQQGQQLAVSS